MRVLITGAAGVLAQAIVGKLEGEAGYELVLTDMVPLETGHEFVAADLSDAASVEGLCEGVDQVLHVAAIHPWKPYTAQQYLDLNIKGTHNVVAEAARAGVNRLIYTSSVAAMGYEIAPDAPLPFSETRPCRPCDSLYSVSKHVGEQLCQLYHQTAGLNWLALRPGTFVPREESDPQYAVSLLGIGVHREDVAQAHVRALRSDVVNEAVIVTAEAAFTPEDEEELLTDAAALILRRYPAAEAIAEPLPKRLCPCYSINKARELLGYEPQHTFARWLENHLS